MIYTTAIVFPIVALIASVTVLGALLRFVLDIHKDIRTKPYKNKGL